MYRIWYTIFVKDVIWHGDSRDVIRGFPEQVRKDIGAELMLLQISEAPLHSRPMPTVGRGVWEIKVRDEGNQYRVFYVVRRREAIHVLHAFQKRSRKTAKADIQLGKQRLKQL